MTKRTRDPRVLSAEEKRLWKLVNKDTKRLHKSEGDEESESSAPKAQKPAPEIKVRRTQYIAPPEKIQSTEPVRAAGEYAGIDRNTAEKFRKGNYAIDATLDLHGMTAANAYEALARFIHSHSRRESRCLLVVTGKGTRGEGVLKKSLPLWLSHGDLSPMVLAFDVAKAKHGGSGAYYVLLRRKR